VPDLQIHFKNIASTQGFHFISVRDSQVIRSMNQRDLTLAFFSADLPKRLA